MTTNASVHQLKLTYLAEQNNVMRVAIETRKEFPVCRLLSV